MYFAILWKNIEISKKELETANIKNPRVFWNFYISFDCETPEKLNDLWWIIKRWKQFDTLPELEDFLNQQDKELKILWVNKLDLWKELKTQLWIRRFKVVKEQSTDIEVKKKWIEIIYKWDKYLLVLWYQNIKLYEEVDFNKPSRSMKMWMMPAKLTHIMINLALKNTNATDTTMVYDPFAGSGTTWMLANYFNLDTVMSDIDIFHLHRNIQWRREHKDFSDAHTYYFEHDIKNTLDVHKILKKFQKSNIAIVTEWWLGPVVGKNTKLEEVKQYQKDVSDVYRAFLNTVKDIQNFSTWNTSCVFTIPYYTEYPKVNYLEDELTQYWKKIWLNISSIDELYKRKGQYVGRKILIVE